MMSYFVGVFLSLLTWVNSEEPLILHAPRGGIVLIPGVRLAPHGFLTWQFHRDVLIQTEILSFHIGSKDAEIIHPYMERVEFFTHNASFLLKNLDKADAGFYTITLIKESKQNLRTFNLKVIDILSKPQIQRKDENNTITLTCNVPEEAEHFNWRKDGRNLSMGNNIYFHTMRKEYCGVYWCIVENAVSSKQSDFALQFTDYLEEASIYCTFVTLALWPMVFLRTVNLLQCVQKSLNKVPGCCLHRVGAVNAILYLLSSFIGCVFWTMAEGSFQSLVVISLIVLGIFIVKLILLYLFQCVSSRCTSILVIFPGSLRPASFL
ncbi:CD48 antigen isoform X2 [Amia ocellicauda]|uniref:CD48 antigen isoform X2 n=1 Tax=Amia ocellicauda TaxID=2972642 RepID=UPI003464CA6A